MVVTPTPCQTPQMTDLVVGAADPAERDRIEIGAFAAEQPAQRDGAREHPDDAAVARQHVVELADQVEARGARLVAHDELRIARHVAGEIAADQPRIDVVGAARRIAEVERHALAFVEVGDVVGAGGRANQHRGGCGVAVIQRTSEYQRMRTIIPASAPLSRSIMRTRRAARMCVRRSPADHIASRLLVTASCGLVLCPRRAT